MRGAVRSSGGRHVPAPGIEHSLGRIGRRHRAGQFQSYSVGVDPGRSKAEPIPFRPMAERLP